MSDMKTSGQTITVYDEETFEGNRTMTEATDLFIDQLNTRIRATHMLYSLNCEYKRKNDPKYVGTRDFPEMYADADHKQMLKIELGMLRRRIAEESARAKIDTPIEVLPATREAAQ